MPTGRFPVAPSTDVVQREDQEANEYSELGVRPSGARERPSVPSASERSNRFRQKLGFVPTIEEPRVPVTTESTSSDSAADSPTKVEDVNVFESPVSVPKQTTPTTSSVGPQSEGSTSHSLPSGTGMANVTSSRTGRTAGAGVRKAGSYSPPRKPTSTVAHGKASTKLSTGVRKPANRTDTRIPRRQDNQSAVSPHHERVSKRQSPEGGVSSGTGGSIQTTKSSKSNPLTQHDLMSHNTNVDGENQPSSSTGWANSDPYDSLADASTVVTIGSEEGAADDPRDTIQSDVSGRRKESSADSVQRLAAQYRNALSIPSADRSLPMDSGFSSGLQNVTQSGTGTPYVPSPAISPIPSPRSGSPVRTASLRPVAGSGWSPPSQPVGWSPGVSPRQSPFSSPVLPRRGMSHTPSDSAIGLGMSSVPDTALSSSLVSPRPSRSSVSSSVSILRAEKDVLEKQLSRAQLQIAGLQAEKKLAEDKNIKLPGIIHQLEEQLQTANSSMDSLRQEHALALAQKERQLNSEKEWAVEEANRKRRDAERQRDTLKAEIEAVEAALEVSRKEVAVARQTASVNEKRKRKTSEDEAGALRLELQAMKSLLHETEESRQRDQRALQDSTAQLTTTMKELSVLKQQLSELKRQPTTALDETGKPINVARLQAQLKATQELAESLQEQKAAALAAAEEEQIKSSLELQIAHKHAMRKLKAENEQLQSANRAQDEQITQLTSEVNILKLGAARDEEHKRSLVMSPSGVGRSKAAKQNSAMQYSFGQWTAHRADTRKHAEEMRIIIEALEEEGFGPKQATADEVIRHIWWKKEKANLALNEAEESLNSMPGGDPRSAMQKWKTEREDLTRVLEEAREAMSSKVEESQLMEDTLKSEIQQLVAAKQQASHQVEVLKTRLATAEKSSQELEETMQQAQDKITVTDKKLGLLQAEKESMAVALTNALADKEQECRQVAMLRAECKTLRSDLEQKETLLKESIRERAAVSEKLGTASVNAEQSQQQIVALKAQIGHLESEMSLHRQRVETIQSARDSVQALLDEARAHATAQHAALSREQQQVATLRAEVSVLEDHFNSLRREVEQQKAGREAVQGELEAVRAALMTSQESVQTLEAENTSLQAELSDKVAQLQQNSVEQASLSKQLTSVRDECDSGRRQTQQLMVELGQRQAQLDVAKATISRLEAERETLDASLGEAKADIETTGHHVERLKHEEQAIRAELAARRHDLELARSEGQTLAQQVAATREQLVAEQKLLEEKQQRLQQIDLAWRQEQERTKQMEVSQQLLTNKLETAQEQQQLLQEQVAEWKAEADRYQERSGQLEVDVGKLQQQIEQLQQVLQNVQEKAKNDSQTSETKIQQLQESKTRLDSDVASALATIDLLNAEKQSLQQQFAQLQQLLDDERALRSSEAEGSNLRLQQKDSALENCAKTEAALQEELENVQAELDATKSLMEQQEATHSQEFRQVLEHLEQEAVKAQKNHEEQVQQITDSEQSALQDVGQLREELQSLEGHCNGIERELDLSKTKIRGLQEEKAMLEQQLGEVRRELSRGRDEEMRLVQETGRLQSQHTEQLKRLSEQQQETLQELSAAHQVSQFMGQENGKLQQQVDQLRSSLQETRQAMDKMRTRHQVENEELNKKLQELAGSETKAHRDIQNLHQEHEVQVASLRAKASGLEAELARQTTTNRLLETECASLKTRLAMAAEDLETSLSANNALEKSVEMEKQAQSRMENALKEEITKQQQIAHHLSQQLSEVESKLSVTEQNYEDVRVQLESTLESCNELQNQVTNRQGDIEAISEKLRQTEQGMAAVEGELSGVKTALAQEKEDNEQLRKRLEDAMKQVDAKQEESLVAQTRFNSLFSSLQQDFEQDKNLLYDEKQALQEEVDKLSGETENLHQQVKQRETDLRLAQDDLKSASKTNANTLEALESEMNLRSSLQQEVAKLTEEKRVAEQRITNLEGKNQSGQEQREKIQGQLDAANRASRSLRDQLQQNREAAANSISQLKEQLQMEAGRHEKELEQLQEQLAQTRNTLAATKSTLEVTCNRRDQTDKELHEMEQQIEVLQSSLKDEMTQRQLADQRIKHLETRIKEDKRLHVQSREKLKHLQHTLSRLESSSNAERTSREMVEEEKNALDTSLRAEKTHSQSLQEQVESLQAQLMAASQRLEEEGNRFDLHSRKASQEMESQRMQFTHENRKLQSSLGDLSAQVDKLKGELEMKSREMAMTINELSLAKEQSLKKERKLADLHQVVADRADKEEKLTLRNHELQVEINSLKGEIDMLKKSEEDIKEYKKRLDTNSRAEMHRILSEVSRHMEQQHLAHRNLDKMRAENEIAAREEGDRKASTLQQQLLATQAELDQLQVRYKSLKDEFDQLRQLRKDDLRARRRLETRLDRVNETLAQSKASHMLSPAYPGSPVRDLGSGLHSLSPALDTPLLSSTPHKSKDYK